MRIKYHVAAGLITVAFAAATFLFLTFVFDQPRENPTQAVVPVIDVVPVAVVDTPAVIESPEPAPETKTEIVEHPAQIGEVRDVFVEDNRVWVATADGLLQTDRNGLHYRLIQTAEGLDPTTIAEIIDLDGRILFCSVEGFFEYLGPDVFRQVELPLTPPVNFCHAFDSLSYIAGYDDGLFQYTPDVPVLLKSDLLVTALAFGPDGLWVGTDGDGLWHFDGRNWQKRFLRVDTAAFDFVTTLAYRWPNLVVGTQDGLYRFDGGKWETNTGSQSDFPGGWITDIAFANHRWYIGTADAGLWIYNGETFSPVEQLAETGITRIRVYRNDVYVGTRENGVLIRRAGQWRPLYLPDDSLEISPQLLTLL